MIGAQKAVIVFDLEIIVGQLRKLCQDPLLSAVDRSNRNEHPFAWTSGFSLTEDQASGGSEAHLRAPTRCIH
jgi:hypothetical protein